MQNEIIDEKKDAQLYKNELLKTVALHTAIQFSYKRK